MDQFWEYFSVLAPSIGVFLVFWFVYRAITRADALERETEEQVRQEAGTEPQQPATPGAARAAAAEAPEANGTEDTEAEGN